jgi:hypothetical protein
MNLPRIGDPHADSRGIGLPQHPGRIPTLGAYADYEGDDDA